MKERSLDQKILQAHPDTFDIIKVTDFIADAKLEKGMIVFVVTVDAEESGLPDGTTADAVILISEETTLLGDDAVKLIGYKRNYSAIQFATQPTFASDLTSVIVAGDGKDMSLFNSVTQPITVYGYFNKIQIPTDSTDTVIVAYR